MRLGERLREANWTGCGSHRAPNRKCPRATGLRASFQFGKEPGYDGHFQATNSTPASHGGDEGHVAREPVQLAMASRALCFRQAARAFCSSGPVVAGASLRGQSRSAFGELRKRTPVPPGPNATRLTQTRSGVCIAAVEDDRLTSFG
jgi:hypothetical protein